jgi:molybdopterin-guanine dinucleotide biosynthesis protein A
LIFAREFAISLDYATLSVMRAQHPAWRLLAAEHAPLVASFLHRVFITPNVRVMSQADLTEALKDTLFGLRERLGEKAFPKSAQEYLTDWAVDDKGWLRKFYPPGSDEPHFDLTPATERALSWLVSLSERAFVGTASRLLTLFELLKQMSEGSQTSPEARMADLHKRRAVIDAEIALVVSGDMPLLDDTAIKERFQQFADLARELLTDFREVEHNFRGLDRRVRERIALWDGAKGALLEEIMGERDAIADSDQGKSFRAFWDFLMSQSRQEELTQLLERVLQLPPVVALSPDFRLKRVHYDWLEAGEHAQATVAQLSQQLRRFLDDQAWLENRRIMDILRGIEARTVALRTTLPKGDFMEMADLAVSLELPMERPLYRPPLKTALIDVALEDGEADMDTAALFAQVRVNKALLASYIRQSLQTRAQVSLGELLAERPLEQGLGELLAYLQLASEAVNSVVDEATLETVEWLVQDTLQGNLEVAVKRRAQLPRVIFVRQ